MKNCLSCRHFTRCDDPKKSVIFICGKYEKKAKRVIEGVVTVEKTTEAPNFERMELDMSSLLKDILDPQTKIPRDMRIDDRDLPTFKNYYEFICGRSGLNMKPFSRQLYLNLMLCHERCPVCSNKKYSNIMDVPVDMDCDDLRGEMVLLEHGVCPKCKRTKLDFFRERLICAYNELAALVGQRSGKSTMIVAPMAVYSLHRFLKLPRPYQVYGLNPTTLVGTLVAQTYAAAYEQLWLPIRSYMEESPWFQEYHSLLNDYQLRHGTEIFKFQPTLAHYMHKMLLYYPSGPNRKTLRGKTRVFCLAGGQLVSSDRGYVPLSQLLVTDRAYLKDRFLPISDVWKTGIKPTFEVQTSLGYSITGTADHKIRVLSTGTTWKKIQDVRANDLILVNKGGSVTEILKLNFSAISKQTFPSQMTRSLAKLLGYMITDGSYSYSSDRIFSFGNRNENLIKDFVKCFVDVFSIQPRVSYCSNSRCHYARFYYANLKAFFRYLGLGRQSKRKGVPWSILQSSDIHVSAFLEAMYDGDGASNAFFASASRKLVSEVQLLWLRLGVVSEVRNAGYVSELIIDANQVPLMLEHIRLLSPRVSLSRMKEDYYSGKNTYRKPNQILKYRELGQNLIAVPFSKTVSRGMKAVYDVTIDDKKHAFVANGIVVCNCAIDELDYFDAEEGSEKVKMNGREVYIALDRSLMTVRAAWVDAIKQGQFSIPPAYMTNVSSPDHSMGTLTTHVDRNKDSRRVLTLHAATWEINPRLTRKKLEPYFREDMVKAMRDYGAVPPLSDSPFIDDPSSVERLASNFKNRVSYEYTAIKVKTVDGFVDRRTAILTRVNPPSLVRPSVLSIDAGFSNNSMALVVGHRFKTPGSESFTFACDVFVEVAPRKGKLNLHYTSIAEQIIYPLIRAFNVKAVFADRWNSLKILHDINHEFGIIADVYSLKYKDMTLVRGYMEDRGVIIPAYKLSPDKRINFDRSQYPHNFQYLPIDHFYTQCLTVRDTGREVIKGPKMTDDLWRAFALTVRWLSDDNFCEQHLVGDKEFKSRGGVIASTSPDGSVLTYGKGVAISQEQALERFRTTAAASGTGFTIINGMIVATGS